MEINEKNILLISVSIFSVILLLSIFVFQELALFINLLILGVIVIVVPYSIFQFIEFRKLKNCENEFPNFLRDLAEAKRTGLSIIQAINNCSKSDYGLLTKDIQKLNNQLTWNIPLKKVLENFRKTFRRSSIISHSALVISQIEESGGKTEDIMESLADNIESIKEAQAEKNLLMNQHVMTMYALFFIFFGISIALIKFLTPLFTTQEEIGGLGIIGSFGGNPCQMCINSISSSCITCNIFFSFCSAFNFGAQTSVTCYYKSLFFVMIMIQGIFSGLIAGQISSDSIVAGVKHSLIMVISSFILFLTVSTIGLI